MGAPTYDKAIARDQHQLLAEIYAKYGHATVCQLFRITAKQPIGGTKFVPFRLNRVQQQLARDLRQRNIVLKARQMGITTFFVLERLLLPALLTRGTTSLLIAQQQDVAQEHMCILRGAIEGFGSCTQLGENQPRFQDHLLALRCDTRLRLEFDYLESKILAETAENHEVGQGLPGVNHLLATEFGRWSGKADETLANAAAAVTPDGTTDIESTANGYGGAFFEICNQARSGASPYQFHFFPWPLQHEYRIDNPEELARYLPDPAALSEEEQQLQRQFSLDLNQLAWRRRAQMNFGRDFPEKYPENPDTAFLVSGDSFFDRDALRRRALELETGQVRHGHNEPAGGGYFDIFRKPNLQRQYILHADPALGTSETTHDPDWSAFAILDQETGEQVAAYRSRLPPEDFAFHIVDAAQLFANATVSVESNPGGGGDSVLLAIRNLKYGNIFEFQDWDDRTGRKSARPGLPMNLKTRPVCLHRLAQAIRHEVHLIHDRQFIAEALAFQRNAKGRVEAPPGAHDDLVMAMAGAHFVRYQLLGFSDPPDAEF